MRRWIALCVVAGLSFGASCSRKSDGTQARLRVDGRAEVAGPNQAWQPFSGERRVRAEDQIRIVEGTGVISLSDDRQLELRTQSDVQMVAVGDDELGANLRAGDLLVVAPEGGVTVTIAEGQVDVSGGAARLSRGQTVVVGSYTASVDITSAGQEASVRALRQVGVPAAGLPTPPKPIVYSVEDSWDQRFLGQVPQLAGELLARSQGFTAQMPASRPQTPDFFRELLPGLAGEPVDPRVARPRPAGESLVGLAIAMAGTNGTFAERWDQVIAFRDAGADWGLVALDQGAARVPLLAEIDAAIGRGLTLFQGPASPPPAGSPPAPGSPAAVAAAPSGGGSTSAAAPAPTPSSPNSSPPAPADNTGPLRTGIAPIDSAANSLVDLLSGLLNSLGK